MQYAEHARSARRAAFADGLETRDGRGMTDAGTRAIELLDPEFQHDPFPALATCRRVQPVVQPDDIPAFVLTRYEDVLGMRDEAMYSVSFIKMVRESIDGPSMIQMDGAEHHRNRSLVAVGFRPRFLNEFVEARGRTHSAPAPRRPASSGPRRAHARVLRATALLLHCRAPRIRDRRPTLLLSAVYRDFIASVPCRSPWTRWRDPCGREVIDDLLTPIVDWHMANENDGFISRMIRAENKDGERLREEEVYGFLRFLLPAGEDTTMSVLGTLMYNVLSRPRVRAAVESDPSVLTNVVEESLRWRGADRVQVNRITVSDQDLRGVHIPAGSLVLGALNSANRDEDRSSDPTSSTSRDIPNRHLTFGTGVHMCIGACRWHVRPCAVPPVRSSRSSEPPPRGRIPAAVRGSVRQRLGESRRVGSRLTPIRDSPRIPSVNEPRPVPEAVSAAVPDGAVLDHVAVAALRIRDLLPIYHDLLGGRFLTGGDNRVVGYRAVHLGYDGGGKIELLEPLARLDVPGPVLRRARRRPPPPHVPGEGPRRVGRRDRGRGFAPFGLNWHNGEQGEVFIHRARRPGCSSSSSSSGTRTTT